MEDNQTQQSETPPSRFLADPDEIKFTQDEDDTSDTKSTEVIHSKVKPSPFRKQE